MISLTTNTRRNRKLHFPILCDTLDAEGSMTPHRSHPIDPEQWSTPIYLPVSST
jgi:hypothetical protein